jgi:hypothetical protein
MGRWLDRLPKETVPWLLERACPPIKLRVLKEVLGRPDDDWDVRQAREGVNQYPPSVAVGRLQAENGVWFGKLLDFEPPNNARKKGPGTVNQFLMLVESGWSLNHPICHCTELLLRQHLDPAAKPDLHELKGYLGEKPALEEAMRAFMRRVAAALLARAGLKNDPALDAVGEETLALLDKHYADPEKPDVYAGVVEVEEGETKTPYRLLKEGAIPIDHFTWYLLAFWGGAKKDAATRAIVSRVVRHLFVGDHGTPRLLVEVDGKRLLKLRTPPIADWSGDEFHDRKIAYLLHDLELLARTRTLAENPKAVELLERLLGSFDEDGVVRADGAIEKHVARSLYHYFPLEESWRGKHKKYTDVAFRITLILKLLDDAEAG